MATRCAGLPYEFCDRSQRESGADPAKGADRAWLLRTFDDARESGANVVDGYGEGPRVGMGGVTSCPPDLYYMRCMRGQAPQDVVVPQPGPASSKVRKSPEPLHIAEWGAIGPKPLSEDTRRRVHSPLD